MYTVRDPEIRRCEMNIFHQSVLARRLRRQWLKNYIPPTRRRAVGCIVFIRKNSKNGINYHNFSTVYTCTRVHKK